MSRKMSWASFRLSGGGTAARGGGADAAPSSTDVASRMAQRLNRVAIGMSYPCGSGRDCWNSRGMRRSGQGGKGGLDRVDAMIPHPAFPVLGVGIEGIANLPLDGFRLRVLQAGIGVQPVVLAQRIEDVAFGRGAHLQRSEGQRPAGEPARDRLVEGAFERRGNGFARFARAHTVLPQRFGT